MQKKIIIPVIIIFLLLLLCGSYLLIKFIKDRSAEQEDSKVKETNGLDSSTIDIEITSSAFTNNSPIPSKYTCEGEDINPPLEISNVPEGTISLALVIDDPNAPAGSWIHWIVWNINPNTEEILENSTPEGSVVGKNSWNRNSYGGPCPPVGEHQYIFKIYALDTRLDIDESKGIDGFEDAIGDHVLAFKGLMGTYTTP